MGNVCCPTGSGENKAALDTSRVGASAVLHDLPKSRIRADTSPSESSMTPSEPKNKLEDYLAILDEAQADNLIKMREQLKKKPELFVLNNLILSIQFFENFDRDSIEIRDLKVEQESLINGALSDIRRRCHYEGALTETIGRHYRYLGKGMGLSEVVPSRRYNIIHKSMEVYPMKLYSSLVSKEYTSVDEPLYRFCMEDVEKMPGWVMLRCVDLPAGFRNQRNSLTSNRIESLTYDHVDIDSDGYSKYSDGYGKSSGYDSLPGDANERRKSYGEYMESNGTTTGGRFPGMIAGRPPMKTPDHTSGSSSEEADIANNKNPQTGKELMNGIETQMRVYTSKPGGKRHPGRAKQAKSLYSDRGSTMSGDDDYDYTSITDLPRSLRRPTSRKEQRNSTLPLECFQSLKLTTVDTVDNPLGLGAQVEWKTYFSSTGFFSFFEDSFYEWSSRIDRGQCLEEAKAFRASILCTQITETPNCKYRSNLEFVPVIPVPQWPEIAKEWTIRPRPAILDKRTNYEYRWPRPSQIDAIVKQGCHLITEGGKFRGRNSENVKLEWQLSFGAAQEALFSSLSQSHLRVLLWARLVFRHVLVPTGVLSPQHLDTVFFWLVESNYIDWPEAELGERLLAIFETLYDCIKRRKLPHYFISKRNLLHTKAPRDIFKAQEKLFRLIESFVPLTIQTAKYIQTSYSIYPMLDLNRLWEIVTTPLSLELLMNPSLLDASRNSKAPDASAKKRNRKSSDEGFWDTVQKQQGTGDKTRDYLRKERARLEAEEREKRPVSIEESSLDKAEKVTIGAFNITQTKMLLEFFIDHFISMARCSLKVRAHSTTIVLLSQAENMVQLLDEDGFYEQAEKYQEEIDSLKIQPKPFTEPLVDIPGTPCVFPTGIPQGSYRINDRVSRNSSNFAPKIPVPLPDTPDDANQKSTAKANGSAVKRQAPTIPYDPDKSNNLTPANANGIGRPGKTFKTQVDLEFDGQKSSETEPTDQYDDGTSPPMKLNTSNKSSFIIRKPKVQEESDDDEATDF